MPLYIAPLVWDTSGNQPFNFWRQHARARDMFDLRSLESCRVASGTPGEAIVFATGAAPIPSDWELLGNDKQDLLSAAAKTRLNVQSARLGAALMERIVDSADDTNLLHNHPIWPGTDGKLRWSLGPIDITIDPDRLASWWPTIRRAMRRMVTDAPLEVRRKVLHVLLSRNLRIAPTRQNAVDWMEYDDDPQTPTTSIADDFVRADSSSLGTAGAGWSWTELDGNFSIVSNTAAYVGAADGRAIAGSALSSADHSATFIWTAGTTGISGMGPCCRMVTGGADTSYFYFARVDTNTYLYKIVTGTYTQLGSTGTQSISLPDTLKLNCSGSNQTGTFNGVTDRTGTDTAITSNLYTGLFGQVGNTVNVRGTPFNATDGIGGRLLSLLGVGT